MAETPEVNWKKTGYSYDVVVNVVHQTNVDIVLGMLSGVQLSGMTITQKYYSDSRDQAKLTTIVPEGESDGYIKNARLRIVMSIPSRFWSEELITGYVSDVDTVIESGYTKRTYTIEGTMWGLLEHKLSSNVIIGAGSRLINNWASEMSSKTTTQFDTSRAQDHVFGSNIVYEAGTVFATYLFEMCSGYNRMYNDGHGRVVLAKYIEPSKMTPTRVIDYKDTIGLSMAPLSANDTSYESPGEAIVTATVSQPDPNDENKTIQKVLVGHYAAPSSHPTSMATRGFMRSRSDSYNGAVEKPSVNDLNAQAKKNWEESQDKGITWSVSSVFANYHAGEVVTLVAPYGFEGADYSHKVLISEVQTNMDYLTQNLTLKEV